MPELLSDKQVADAYGKADVEPDDETGAVFAAIPAIMAALSNIEKGGKAPAAMGGYAFRGIDDIVAALHPLLAEHGVFVAPQLVSLDTELSTVGDRKQQYNRITRYRFRFYGKDGSYFDTETVSEGMDTRDKGCNKSATACFKIALQQVFAIHSADSPDPETDTVQESEAAPAPKPSAWWAGKPEAEAVVRDIGLFAEQLGAETVTTTRAWLGEFAKRAVVQLADPASTTTDRTLLKDLGAKAGELQGMIDATEPPEPPPGEATAEERAAHGEPVIPERRADPESVDGAIPPEGITPAQAQASSESDDTTDGVETVNDDSPADDGAAAIDAAVESHLDDDIPF